LTRDEANAVASELRRDPSHSLRSAAAAVGLSPAFSLGWYRRLERAHAKGARGTPEDDVSYQIVAEALEERHRLLRQEAALSASKESGHADPGYHAWCRHLLEVGDRDTHGAVSKTEIAGVEDQPLEIRESIDIVEARVREMLGSK
jgi:hypothetical protein